MSATQQRYVSVGLIALVVCTVIVFALPASDLGLRFLHALFFALIAGCAAAVPLLVLMFVMAYRERSTPSHHPTDSQAAKLPKDR